MKLKIVKENKYYKFVAKQSKSEYITEKQFNGDYDYTYLGDVSEEIAKELYVFLGELVNKGDINEQWNSRENMLVHRKDHCKPNVMDKSKNSDIRYDFNTERQLIKYEQKVNDKLVQSPYVITTLSDTALVYKCFKKLFEGNTAIIFDTPCKFANDSGRVKIGFNAFSSNVTSDYNSGNTVDVCVLTPKNITISMYPIDAHYVETKVKDIILNHLDAANLPQFYFNKD